jgi:hypothetical protein
MLSYNPGGRALPEVAGAASQVPAMAGCRAEKVDGATLAKTPSRHSEPNLEVGMFSTEKEDRAHFS